MQNPPKNNDGRKIEYHIISRLGAAGVQKKRGDLDAQKLKSLKKKENCEVSQFSTIIPGNREDTHRGIATHPDGYLRVKVYLMQFFICIVYIVYMYIYIYVYVYAYIYIFNESCLINDFAAHIYKYIYHIYIRIYIHIYTRIYCFAVSMVRNFASWYARKNLFRILFLIQNQILDCNYHFQ